MLIPQYGVFRTSYNDNDAQVVKLKIGILVAVVVWQVGVFGSYEMASLF